MKNKIRFKRHQAETGLASIGAGKPSVDIKINGKCCGYIAHPSWRSSTQDIRIKFMVYKEDTLEDGNPNSDWKWVTLKFIPKTEDEAREFIKKNVDTFVEKLKLHYEED